MMDKIDELRVKAAELASKMEPALTDARKRFKTAGAKVIRDLRRGERFARNYIILHRPRKGNSNQGPFYCLNYTFCFRKTRIGVNGTFRPECKSFCVDFLFI